jgi:diaminopimelate epimerase
MELTFFKYQGTGNDFIIIDNRKSVFPRYDNRLIQKLCHRNFGIGADGLMLLESSGDYDFKMVYFNADGHEGTMCGNGGRCIVAFARSLNIFEKETVFEATDGIHHARMNEQNVSLEMKNVTNIQEFKDHVFLDTGSPHHVEFTDDLSKIDIYSKGKEIRYGKPYFEEGTNVNFVQQISEDSFKVRTYERGVENETLSCGTGVTAVALATDFLDLSKHRKINLQTLGGDLSVEFNKNEEGYQNIYLSGPATFVFKGTISI